MRIKDIFARRTPRRPNAQQPRVDWTTNWTPRDWADLPVYHPRHDPEDR